MSLTAKQQELLDAMRGGVRCIYMRYMGSFNTNAYYYRSDNHKKCTAQAKALLERGLVERFDRTPFGDHSLRFKQPTPEVPQ